MKAVSWLITKVIPDLGALPRDAGQAAPDVIATTLAMEAIRRSDFVDNVPHVLAAGDAWLVSGQTVLGGWQAEPWAEDFVAAMVLEYLARQNEMLPQVDGFLLMARDFFRKAEELRLEGGANNRRLSAIRFRPRRLTCPRHTSDLVNDPVFDENGPVENLAIHRLVQSGGLLVRQLVDPIAAANGTFRAHMTSERAFLRS
ncbi:hypothetical protein SLT36_31835 (plasmid) [Aminobacter sp. BA135]|uniref:hypothetical protein n=1 Tax=Aminobacter sp. BA135 TaxID=537596 RepID=UPI003D78DEF2